MLSGRQHRDVADRKVVRSKTKIGGALPKGLAIEVPVDDLIVKTLSVRCVQNAGKRGVVTDHHLNRSDHEHGVCERRGVLLIGLPTSQTATRKQHYEYERNYSSRDFLSHGLRLTLS
jgi:hypothetical protein